MGKSVKSKERASYDRNEGPMKTKEITGAEMCTDRRIEQRACGTFWADPRARKVTGSKKSSECEDNRRISLDPGSLGT